MLQTVFFCLCKNPFRKDGAVCGVLQVSKGAVVTSGDYERYMDFNGKRYHHIIDARSMQIRNDISSATVFAQTATAANACSTAIMALGAEEGAKYAAGKPGARSVIIASNGKVARHNMNDTFLAA